LPNGKLKGVIRITIEEKEDLNSIIDRAAKLLWDGKNQERDYFTTMEAMFSSLKVFLARIPFILAKVRIG
jgi:hypothetical protein